MRRSGQVISVAPTIVEREALRIVARYLMRAGSATATLLLLDETDGNGLAFALRDQYDAGAAFCLGLLDALDE